jgi:hypothetical protein
VDLSEINVSKKLMFEGHGDDDDTDGAEDVEAVGQDEEGEHPVADVEHVLAGQDPKRNKVEGQRHERPGQLKDLQCPESDFI